MKAKCDHDLLEHPLVVSHLQAVADEAARLGPVRQARAVLHESERVTSYLREAVDPAACDDDEVAAALAHITEQGPDVETLATVGGLPSTMSAKLEGVLGSTSALTLAAALTLVIAAFNPIAAALGGALVAVVAWRRGSVDGMPLRGPYRSALLLALAPVLFTLGALVLAIGQTLFGQNGILRG